MPTFQLNRHLPADARLPRALVLLAALATVAHAGGLTFTVNTAADLPDANVLTSNCDADINTPGDQITLRAAVMQANHEPGADTIIIPEGIWKLTLQGEGEDLAALGDLDVTEDLTITGVPADPAAKVAGTVIDGKKLKDRLFDVKPGASLVLQGVTLRNSKAPTGESGGALRVAGSAELSAVIISKCKSPVNGGAIDLLPGTGELTLTDVFLQKDTATGDGGGIDVEGGQIHATGVTWQSCHAGGQGGGLTVNGALAALSNVTFGSNSAGLDGGGIALRNGAVLTAVNATLWLNSSKAAGGITAADAGDSVNTVLLRNTLLDNKGKRNFAVVGALPVSLGGNLESGATCQFPEGDQSNVKALLLKLKNYGGFTPTCALKSTSPAIDAGVDTGAPATDQRGVARVDVADVGAMFVAADCGAFEYVPPTP